MTGKIPGQSNEKTPKESDSRAKSEASNDLDIVTRSKRIFTKKITQLHKKGVSSSGKFGFPVPTYQGNLPQDTTECDTWEESSTRGTQRMFALEEAS